MADGTHISWTSATWNVVTGCAVKSDGCRLCYAMQLAGTRLRNHPSRAGLTRKVNGHHVWTGEVRFNEQWLEQPIHWRRPRDIFVAAHSDLFYDKVLPEWHARIIYIMQRAPHHRFQVLTKRPDNMLRVMRDYPPMPHVLLGVSVERQQEADQRHGPLSALASLGWSTWVSYEPALGPVDWAGWEFIRWMVSGGESDNSGQGRARPSHPNWHRTTRDWCAAHAIPYHFKQWGEWAPYKPQAGGDLGGDVRAGTVRIVHPAGESDVEILVATGGYSTIPGSCFVFHIGKKSAGRLLDGRTWDGMPLHV